MKITFKLKHGSEMEKRYFTQLNERQKFHDHARKFFDKYGFTGKGYIIGERLRVELSDAEREKYSSQLMKDTEQGCSQFKLNSQMQKAWKSEVVDQTDSKKRKVNEFWWLDFIFVGKYAMWDMNGVVYGLLEGKELKPLSEDMERIKLSEYYAVIEESENAD